MDGYEPPTYAQLVMPTIFDAAEAYRRHEAYAELRHEHTKLWHETERKANSHYYQRET